MKVYYECAPCFLRQAREALDLACDDESLKIEVMNKDGRAVCGVRYAAKRGMRYAAGSKRQ